jgi:predicted nicotinamide N-methyase
MDAAEGVLVRVRSYVRCAYDRGAVMELLRGRGEAEHSSWDGQDAFVRTVLQDEVLRQFPVALQYKARLLKAYLDDVTRNSAAEVHEELLSQYLLIAHAAASRTVQALHAAPEGDGEQVFFNFELPDGRVMPVKQQVEFREVSQKMWPAAVALGEYLLQHDEATRGKRVLELGAGVGFTGLLLAKCGHCQSLTLSDYSDSGLDLLKENLRINGAGHHVNVWKLDWTDPLLTDESLSQFDLVYAADCWYDYEVSDVLTQLVERICRLNKCVFVNATAIRNPKTYQLYRDKLLAAGFEATELEPDRGAAPLFHFDSNERYSVVMEQFVLK